MRVLIVDHQVHIRDEIRQLFIDEPEFELIGEARNWKEAAQKASLLKPQLVFIDDTLPGGCWEEEAERFSKSCPGMNMIILGENPTEENLIAAFRCRAAGYILKGPDLANMLVAIRSLNPGEFVLSPRLVQMVLNRILDLQAVQDLSKVYALTSREREVFQLLCMGVSNRDIASSLVISENTVRIHVHNILKKLKLKNRWKVQEKYALMSALPQVSLDNPLKLENLSPTSHQRLKEPARL